MSKINNLKEKAADLIEDTRENIDNFTRDAKVKSEEAKIDADANLAKAQVKAEDRVDRLKS